MKPPVPLQLPVKPPTITVNANSTDYYVSIILFNSQGQVMPIASNTFESISFETLKSTPLLIGTLVLKDEGLELNKWGDDINLKPEAKKMTEVNNLGDGQEFLKIKITHKAYDKESCDYTDVTVLEKVFTTKTIKKNVMNSTRQSIYHFVDIIYSPLYNKRIPWSTNELLEVKPGANKHRKRTSVNCGKALKHLLRKFTQDGRTLPPSEDIIAGGIPPHEDYAHLNRVERQKMLIKRMSQAPGSTKTSNQNWDDGVGKINYTLPSNAPAFTAINEIMDNYVSSTGSGGVLMYLSGQFHLRSIRSLINEVYTNKSRLGPNFAGAYKITTNNVKQEYNNSEAVDLLGKDFNYTPIPLASIQFEEPQPDETIDNLNNHSVASYNSDSKNFKVNNSAGTVDGMNSNVESLPDGDNIQANIDQNTLFDTNKTILFKRDIQEGSNTTMYRGKITLEKKLLDSLTKATFSIPANIDVSANKFIYITIDTQKNNFAKKASGFWYVTRNLTTLQAGQYSSLIECVKLDKPQS